MLSPFSPLSVCLSLSPCVCLSMSFSFYLSPLSVSLYPSVFVLLFPLSFLLALPSLSVSLAVSPSVLLFLFNSIPLHPSVSPPQFLPLCFSLSPQFLCPSVSLSLSLCHCPSVSLSLSPSLSVCLYLAAFLLQFYTSNHLLLGNSFVQHVSLPCFCPAFQSNCALGHGSQ